MPTSFATGSSAATASSSGGGRHVAEPTALTDAEASAYWRELLRVGSAIEATFVPVKLNYDTLGNSVPHLHTHVIPRYADDPRPGLPFPFPDEPHPQWTPSELSADVQRLAALLPAA
jgi:diadenosine tetraphosphate (Ap4A) HIT family hydrolase